MSYTIYGNTVEESRFLYAGKCGDSALLRYFLCINEPPAAGMIAGKVGSQYTTGFLSFRPWSRVLIAMNGIMRSRSPDSDALPPVNSTEAANVASRLIQYTTDDGALYTNPSGAINVWRGPLSKVVIWWDAIYRHPCQLHPFCFQVLILRIGILTSRPCRWQQGKRRILRMQALPRVA